MDKGYFMDDGVSSNPLHLEAIPWNAMEESCLDQGLEQFSHFDSSFSSEISPAPVGNEVLMMPEMMGKRGFALGGNQFVGINDACKFNLPPLSLPSSLPGSAASAKYSVMGSRSFKGRSMNNAELGQRSPMPMMGNSKLSRVCSSPSLNHDGSLPGKQISSSIRRGSSILSVSEGISRKFPRLSSNDDSRKMQSTENELKISDCGDETGTPSFKCQDTPNLKRLKPEEASKTQTTPEDGLNLDSNEKHNTSQKLPEPPKDYIHVRARRGQATDSHSLAERVRREKISERMKLLQDLVPGCNKVTGKALMLDEIINYVQSLQRQVEFLSMKLASVNPGLDFITDNRVTKEIYPCNSQTFHHHHHAPKPHPLLSDSLNRSLPPHHPSFNEDDLNSIILMGLAQDPANDLPILTPNSRT